MKRILSFGYGIFAYVCFLAVFLYAMGFVGDVLVPKSIDSGTAGPVGTAVAVNLALLSLFAVQHSGMARRSFKQFWTKVVPPPIERATYVLFSSAVLAVLFFQWHPMPMVIWNVDNAVGRTLLHALYWTGWGIVLLASCMISHFELFGLRQVWLHLQQKNYGESHFKTVGFYKFVRHPLQTGFLIAFWAAPTMTLGHLLFSVVVTAYILVAVTFFEERDLVRMFGNTYRRYQRQVGMFLPRPKIAATVPAVSADSAVSRG
jgi:protein-S-isoprenylcysteine O-methyltransferase Ste14